MKNFMQDGAVKKAERKSFLAKQHGDQLVKTSYFRVIWRIGLFSSESRCNYSLRPYYLGQSIHYWLKKQRRC